MQDLNTVALVGNVTREPELREGEDWKAANYAIAVGGRGEDEVHFFDCVSWGTGADFAMRNVQKGRRVGLTGRLQQRRWSAEDGTNRSKVEVVVDDLYFLGPRKDGAEPTAPTT